jgi:hypothetical protein
MLQVITAARFAQLSGGSNFYKPLIIPVFYDYKQDASVLNQLIHTNHWGDYETVGSEQEKLAIQTLGLATPDVFQTADVDDPKTTSIIEQLRPGQILLLSLGPLPKIVFDGIYNHVGINIWPQIREGQNTFNSLLLTGKPHFRCQDKNDVWELGYDLITDISFKDRLKKLYSDAGFCRAGSWSKNPNIYQELGELMIESQMAESGISHYFQAIKAETEKPENDRIRRGLEEALFTLQSN